MTLQDASLEARRTVVMPCGLGLTLGVAARVAATARRFRSEIWLASDRLQADAKSILEVVLLRASRGTSLVLAARGMDADRAVQTLSELFENEEVLCRQGT